MQPVRTRSRILVRDPYRRRCLPAVAVLATVALAACGGGGPKEAAQAGNAAPTTATTALTSPSTGAPSTAASSTSTGPAATQPPATTAATSPTAAPVKTAAVTVSNFAFQPPSLTVAPGTTITWTNQDDTEHSIKDTSPLHTPESKHLAKGDTFSITYSKPGTYAYICGIHNYMMGSVTVK